MKFKVKGTCYGNHKHYLPDIWGGLITVAFVTWFFAWPRGRTTSRSSISGLTIRSYKPNSCHWMRINKIIHLDIINMKKKEEGVRGKTQVHTSHW